ncbi:MAG: right-handed parallel beta-helix repeat-containing protein [Candidatus Promineifilaceae bacterium]|nr:right-handed parallel beta-helix repeat-containing protein [Candidatus Promineifilaceae bacterium]
MRRHLSPLLFLFLLALVALLLAPSPATAGPPSDPAPPAQVVYPTGSFPTDVENVQAAADNGGRVRLKATAANGAPTPFNFGSDGRVFLTEDVQFLGETVAGATTTIEGGYRSLSSFERVDFSVEGIRFDGARSAAIYLVEASGTRIVGNEIVNVVGSPLSFAPHIRKGQGIWVLSVGSGDMLIAGNVIRDVDAELGYAIAIFGTDATTTIADNLFRGFNTAGILVGEYSSPHLIENNLVAPGPERYAAVSSAGNGILISNFVTQSGAPVWVRGNRIICENPRADGIIANFFTDNVNVSGNHVTMRDSHFGGITLALGASDGYVGANRLDGSASFALSIWNFGILPDVVNDNNTLVGNNIARFEASVADVFFSPAAVDNILIGNSGDVLDLGENNEITGVRLLNGDRRIGDAIGDAQARKLEFLRSVESRSVPASP